MNAETKLEFITEWRSAAQIDDLKVLRFQQPINSDIHFKGYELKIEDHNLWRRLKTLWQLSRHARVDYNSITLSAESITFKMNANIRMKAKNSAYNLLNDMKITNE